MRWRCLDAAHPRLLPSTHTSRKALPTIVCHRHWGVVALISLLSKVKLLLHNLRRTRRGCQGTKASSAQSRGGSSWYPTEQQAEPKIKVIWVSQCCMLAAKLAQAPTWHTREARRTASTASTSSRAYLAPASPGCAVAIGDIALQLPLCCPPLLDVRRRGTTGTTSRGLGMLLATFGLRAMSSGLTVC